MMLIKSFYILFFLFISFQVFPQECFDYYKSGCVPKPSKFSYAENNSSVSFLFSSGEIRELPFTLVNGIDYRITLCADSRFEDIIQFAILTNEGKEMYNNSNQNYNLNLEFACRKTREVTFQLSAPQPIVEAKDTIYIEGCIGILVEEMVSVKTGF